jgi:hypothetical protein
MQEVYCSRVRSFSLELASFLSMIAERFSPGMIPS